VYLDGVTIVDDGEGVASGAGAAADAVGGAAGATADGVGGVSELAVSTILDLMDGFHSLTGLPWLASYYCGKKTFHFPLFFATRSLVPI